MTLDIKKQYLIMFHSNALCLEIFRALFAMQEDNIKKNPLIEQLCLGVAANIIDGIFNTEKYSDLQYSAYIKNTLVALAAPETKIHEHAMTLRGLFNGEQLVLRNSFGFNDRRFGDLPTSQEIAEFIAPKFSLLSQDLRRAYENKTIECGKVHAFIDAKIKETLGYITYIPTKSTQQYLLMLGVNGLCNNVFEGLISYNANALHLEIAANIMDGASDLVRYTDNQYTTYIQTKFPNLNIKHAIDLRGVFSGKTNILDDNRFGALPMSSEIQGLLLEKFKLLSATFRTSCDTKAVAIGNVKSFITSKINDILDPNDYLFL